MSKCNNCPHVAHEGYCGKDLGCCDNSFSMGSGCLGCNCYTAKPAPQEERRKSGRACDACGALPCDDHPRKTVPKPPPGPDWSYE